MASLLAFALPFLLFVSFPSRFWNFDGVACAAALEIGNPAFFFHSNHLLYGFLGFLFWKPLEFLLPRSLPALQLFTSLLSAGALVFLFKILSRTLSHTRLALLLTLSVAATAGVWMWSIEAQVYALGFLGMAAATYALIQPDSPRKWMYVGALHAAAVLGHIVHVLWVLPALFWLHSDAGYSRQKWRQYLSTLAAGILVPYALVIGIFILLNLAPANWLMRWLMGSAALSSNSLFTWHWAGWTGPIAWAMTTLRIFWGSFWPYQTGVSRGDIVLTLISMCIVIGLFVLSWKHKHQRLWKFCALWLILYGIFFWTWEPRTECYRMTDFIPLGILLALGLKSLPRAWQWATAGTLLVTLLWVNLHTRILPMEKAQNNSSFQDVQAVTAATPDNSIYLTEGGLTWIYLLYFTGRTAWNVHSFARDPRYFQAEVQRHLKTRPIFIQATAVHADRGLPWRALHKLIPIKDTLPWLEIQ